MPAENYEETAMANSELRFLTIELMKIAHERNKSFKEVLGEYFKNAYRLKRRVMLSTHPKSYSFKWHGRQELQKR